MPAPPVSVSAPAPPSIAVLAAAAGDRVVAGAAEDRQRRTRLRGAVQRQRVAAGEGARIDGQTGGIRRVIEREVEAAAVEQLEGLDVDDSCRIEDDRLGVEDQLVQAGTAIDVVGVREVAAHQDDVVAAAAVDRVVTDVGRDPVFAGVADENVVAGIAGGIDRRRAGERQVFDIGVENEGDGAVDGIGPAAGIRSDDVIAVIDGEGIVTRGPLRVSLPVVPAIVAIGSAFQCQKEWEDHAKRRVVQPIAARSHATASRRREIPPAYSTEND